MNSDFARRQLEKHGWTDGDGLGRKKNGMSQPIKVNLKMDKTGVGHDPGKEFTDHWWMRAFNDAAKKIKRADQPLQKKDEESKRKAEMSAKRKTFYKGFVKGSTLTNGCETKDSDQSSNEDEESKEKDITSIPTLDDLHKFCDGATGHRAARFGIKMKGKLSRVAAHDKEFEEQSKFDPGILYVKKRKQKSSDAVSSISSEQAVNGGAEMPPNTTDKIQVIEKESQEDNEASLKPMALSETEKKKKKKRKRKKEDEERENAVEDTAQDTAHSLNTEPELNKEIGKKREKKKRKIDALLEEAAVNESDSSNKREIDNRKLTSESQEKPGTKKKKKRKTDILVEQAAINDSNIGGTGNREIDDRIFKSNTLDEPESQEQSGSKKKKVMDRESVLPNDCDTEGSLRKEKRKKDKKRKAEERLPEITTNTLHKTEVMIDVQMSDEVNGGGSDEKLHDEEVRMKKKNKSQHSNLNFEDGPLSNDSLHMSAKKKSKKHKGEMDVPENGIVLAEERVEKKSKKKKKIINCEQNF